MKKSLLWVVVLMLVISMIAAFSFVGCKTATETTAAAETAAVETTAAAETTAVETTAEATTTGEKVTIKLLNITGNEPIMDLIGAKLAEKPLNNIETAFEYVEYSTVHDKIAINESAKAGSYDIYWVITDWMSEFIGGNFLAPLDDYLKTDPIEGWPDAYPSGVLGAQTSNDKLYGIPGHDGPYMLYYRTDLFNDPTEKENFKAKYGYELAPPETWTQFKQIADFFTRPKELYGTCFAGNHPQATPYDLVQIAHNFGAEYFDNDGNPVFNGEQWINALEFLGKMYTENSPEGAAQLDMIGRADLFKEGIIAMYADWTGFGSYFEAGDQSNVKDKVGYALMPKGDANRDSLDIYWCWAISNSSKNPDAAWQVVKFLASAEMELALTTGLGGGFMGVRKSTMENPEVLKMFKNYKTMSEILDGNTFSSPPTPAASQVYDILRIAVQDYLSGKGTAKQVLDNANTKIIEAINELK